MKREIYVKLFHCIYFHLKMEAVNKRDQMIIVILADSRRDEVFRERKEH